MSEIIRETRNAINSRLDMLDVLVSRMSYSVNSNSNSHPHTDTSHDNHRLESLSKRIYNLEAHTERVDNVESTLYKFNDLISNVIQKIQNMEKSHIYIPTLKTPSRDEVIPEVIISETPILSERSQHDEEEEYCDNCGGECDGAHGKSGDAAIADMKSRGLELKDGKIVKIQQEEQEVEAEEEAEEEEEEEVEEEVEEEEEEEEEAQQLELEEFEYKSMTLYRDNENKVYQMDEDGALSDPIGIWDESKNPPRIKKIV